MALDKRGKSKAERVRRFFERVLVHSKGQWVGKPFELLDWQWNDIVLPLFGTLRPDGTRQYRRAYIEVPKKNGKTTLAAGLTLYMLIGDGEQRANVFSAACDRQQAGMIYDEMRSMITSSPILAARLQWSDSKKRITDPKTGSTYQALSKEAGSNEGHDIHALVFDELHVQKTRELWDSFAYGTAARRQPLQIAITTAGVYNPESIGWEQHRYAEGVLDGSVEDPSFFAYIAAADPDDDWRAEATWKAANPSYGVTLGEEAFAEAAREAANEPRKLNSFLRYRLNIWTQQVDQWLDMDRWNGCNRELPDLSSLEGRVCYGGLDLASTTDTTAFVLAFPDADDTYLIYPWFWVPEQAARKRERSNQPMYRNWIREGWMTETPGDCTDYKFIRSTVNDLAQRFDLQEIAYDTWNATQLATQLSEEDGLNLVRFGQGYASMNEPSKELARLVLDGKLVHGGNPVLRWMANNVAIDEDPAGNIKPSKKASTEKIDGIVATIMALGRAMVAPDPRSVYEGRGLIEI